MSEIIYNQGFESIEVSDSVELRAVQDNEATRLYSLIDANRDYLSEYLPWARGQELEDSEKFIAKTQEERRTGESYGFGVYVEGELVGHMSLMYLKSNDRPPEIGYWIAENASGGGIITASAAALSDFGLKTLSLPEIILRIEEGNGPSSRVAEKLGYSLVSTEEKEGKIVNIWRKQNE